MTQKKPDIDQILNSESDEKYLLPVQKTVLKVMTYMLRKGIADEEVMDYLHEVELEYFSLLEMLKVREEQSNIDVKTNLLKYKPDYLENIVKTATRYKELQTKSDKLDIGYARIDIDDFSVLNNTYGHEFGDEVLVSIAKIIKDTIRPTDYAIRFGGEEFDLILPYTDKAGSLAVAEKIRSKVEHKRFLYKKKRVKVTLSIGVSEVEINLDSYYESLKNKSKLKKFWSGLEILQKEADNACYASKEAGKNRVSFYDPKLDYDAIRKRYAENARR